MNRETIRARLGHTILASIFAQGSEEWTAGQYLKEMVDCPWSDASYLLSLPTPVKFSTHACKMAVERHAHPQYELMYVYSGQLTHRFDDAVVTAREGDLVILCPGAHHSIDACGTGDIAVNIIAADSFFSPDFLQLISTTRPIANLFLGQSGERYMHLSSRGDADSRALADLLIAEFLDPDISSVNMIKCHLAALLNALYRVYGQNIGYVYQNEDTGRGDMLFILSYIQNYFATATLTETARVFGYDRYYLSKAIRQKLGLTFVELKHYFCIEEAKRLLTTTDLSVREIAGQVGFNNISYFYKIFREKFEASPAEYRTKHQDQN